MIRNRIHGLLGLAAMCFLMPDGGASGGGMTQPMPAAPPVTGSGTLKTEGDVKLYADDDFTPAAMKWREEQGKTSTLPSSTSHEPEGGGSTAASASVPQGVDLHDENLDLQKKADELTPAPTEFSHVGIKTEHDEEEARRANKRTGQESDTEHAEVAVPAEQLRRQQQQQEQEQ